MSTTFQIWPQRGASPATHSLDIAERGDKFSIEACGIDEETDDLSFRFVSVADGVSPEEIIECALRMVQAALYHVSDVPASKRRVLDAISEM
jgi:hypothetical protein